MIFLLLEPAKKTLLIGVIGLCMNGCSIFTIDTMRNEPLRVPPIVNPNNTHYKNGNDVFIGIAMSGGGSRASNFSAAVLLELQKLGILQQADVISSVSGSSLTAAYYGLYGDNTDPKHLWNEEGVRKAFLKDLQSHWMLDWLKPWNIARYWFTNFTRSDIMIDNLNEELYDGNTYKKLLEQSTQIIINATSYTNGQPFVFTQDHFAKRLNSKLDSFPVANAVMASSAFPGVFHPVTLKDYSLKNNQLPGADNKTDYYEHLIDGGPYDNLGVTSITNILQKRKPEHCLLLVIDAYPYSVSANFIQQANTRNAIDYLFDSGTVLSSTDSMLAKNRTLTLEKAINFNGEDIGFKAYNSASTLRFSSDTSANDSLEKSRQCAVWHLSFQRLYDLQFEWTYAGREVNKLQFLDRVRKVVNSIPTLYRLESIKGDKPETVQDYIFKAANILVKEDKECNRSGNQCRDDKFTYQKVCDLVSSWGLKVGSSCYQ